MELKIQPYAPPGAISFNFDELKRELQEKVAVYQTLVYGNDEIKTAKSDRAKLNKLKKALNDERIRQEREYLQPFNEFKSKINEIISIIDKPVAMIDAQVKNYEEKKKEEKQEAINALFAAKEFPEWITVGQIQDKSWLNATTSMKQIDDNMTGWKNRIETEQKTIESLPEFAFEAMEIYKTTLDMAKAIAEGQRLADIQKRKKEAEAAAEKMRAEAEARRKEEEARKAAEQAGADMAEGYAAGVKSHPEDNGGAWIKFEAYLTIPQAQALRAFFIENGIEFRAI